MGALVLDNIQSRVMNVYHDFRMYRVSHRLPGTEPYQLYAVYYSSTADPKVEKRIRIRSAVLFAILLVGSWKAQAEINPTAKLLTRDSCVYFSVQGRYVFEIRPMRISACENPTQ